MTGSEQCREKSVEMENGVEEDRMDNIEFVGVGGLESTEVEDSTGRSNRQLKKRRFTYHVRSRPTIEVLYRKKRISEQRNITVNLFKGMSCCTRRICFDVVNIVHLVKISKSVMHMDYTQRCESLHSLLTTPGVLVFYGTVVCADFLVKAFRFSKDLQYALKGTRSLLSVERSEVSHPVGSSSSWRDGIVAFLRRTAEQTGNAMPDSK